MKSLYTKDLKKNLIFEKETFAIFEVKRAEDKNGKPYYDLLIGDKTGRVKAKIWSDNIKEVDTKSLKQGRIAQVSGKVDEFKNNLQINVTKLAGVDETMLEDFLESSEFNADDMMVEIQLEIEQIEHAGIRKVLQNMFADEDFSRKFKYWAAAKSIHHEFRSGMIQHILEMISISKGLKRFYPMVNFDILTAGIILHDIGKLEELDASGLGTSYTKKGTLLGHMFLGIQIFEKYGGKDLPEDIYLHLVHLILSHHGTLEFGSPVVPSTIEAVILHYIDNLSAKPRTAVKAVQEIAVTEEFGNYNPWLFNARLWKFKMPEESDSSVVDEDSNNTGDQIPLV